MDDFIDPSEDTMGSGLDLTTGNDSNDGNEEEKRSKSTSPPRETFQRQRPPPLFSRNRRRPPVRFQPWETLLPLEDPEELKESVKEGSLLWHFLDICSPTLSCVVALYPETFARY